MKPALLCFIATLALGQSGYAQCDTSKVADLTANHVTHHSTRFTWNPHPQATGYDYGINTSPTPPDKGHSTINTAIVQQGLSPNTYYCVHVRAHCATGGHSQWQTTCFTTLADLSGVAYVEDNEVSMYPNPAGAFLNIETPAGQHTITLRDLVGRTILTLTSDRQKSTISMSSVRQGLYFVTVSGDGYTRTQRITKE